MIPGKRGKKTLIAAVSLIFLSAFSAFAVSKDEPASTDGLIAHVSQVGDQEKSAAPDVWIDRGIKDGVMPGMKFEIIHIEKLVGEVEIQVSAEHVARGAFAGACEGCRPAVGDAATRAAAGSFRIQPPPIVVPGQGRKPGPVGGDDFKPLSAAFALFMNSPQSEAGFATETEPAPDEGPPVWPKEPPPPPSCPQSVLAGGGEFDADLKSEFYLEPGDTLRVDGWPPLSPFCPAIDKSGYLFLPEIGPVRAVRKTVTALELAIRDKLARKGITARPTLTPVIGASGGAGGVVVFVLGEAANPGRYEFGEGVTVADAVRAAGGATQASNGTAAVIRDVSRTWEASYIKIAAPGEKQPAAEDTTDAGEPITRGVIFLPSSREHLEAFFREVLPYLNE